MRLSFDLDDTLICYDAGIPCEPNRVPWWATPWFEEPLRLGTVELMQELTHQGHDLWIYTTSYREPRKLKQWFGFFGIKISAVINADAHAKLGRREVGGYFMTKYPPAFEIDLHIDNEPILPEGFESVFRVLVLDPFDTEWTSKVLQAVQSLEAVDSG